MENQFAIPVENVIIGSDAVMISDVTAMTLASHNVKSLNSMLEVYNISGKHLGCLQGIEVDDEFIIHYLYTEDYKIEMSRTVNFESVIVVDIEEAELELNTPKEACQQRLPEELNEEVLETVEEALKDNNSEAEVAISMEIEPNIKWNDENCQPKEKNLESSELSVVRAIHQNEEKLDVSGIDAKYAYLCGKQLLEGIDIEDTFYDKGTIINSDMIKHAIGSNAIVKVIVNAEE
jgi:hypothetical protein